MVAPGNAGRRERAGDVALVRRRIRRIEREELANVRHPSAEEMAKGRRLTGEERVFAILVPQTHVNVAARAGVALVPLRHERDRLAVLPSDLLRGVFVEVMAIGHLQQLGVAQSDLLLSWSPLAFRRLDRNAAALQMRADRADEELLFRALRDLVVLD